MITARLAAAEAVLQLDQRAAVFVRSAKAPHLGRFTPQFRTRSSEADTSHHESSPWPRPAGGYGQRARDAPVAPLLCFNGRNSPGPFS
ncbi:Protein of unknown function [Micromonospora lupini str. Lupac 08]|uniref:Uncharacterized protein n=1 Tax=Micromonospora lupini str. Lupac 08 TaxID=1150864 RepID=I0L4A9_9ACTN|nr:Protein of unknown function [Micromonospora lupini str. Lupac 08]